MDDRLHEQIREVLAKEGIELFGFAPLPCPGELESILDDHYLDSLPKSLSYMKKPVWRDPRLFLPWAKSAVCVALPYNTTRESSAEHISRSKAWISRYAWGRDYHDLLRMKLKPVRSLLRALGFMAKIAVDSFPVLERTLARRAGLGFIGNNGLLINPDFGSYLFLGEVLTDAELPYTETLAMMCLDCAKCVSACPSGALTGNCRVDPSLCVSSYNVEWKGEFPSTAPRFSGRLFGCDLCQEACPYNRSAPLSDEKGFEPGAGLFAPEMNLFLKGENDLLQALIKRTPLARRGVQGLRLSAERIRRESQTKREETELSS
ncbi:MAG TPA: tRNA epoxyqueuosine(34) reductase QueG [Acidobacteriota bacterium]|nr:tRNA epoxyqueuosine(34) reductase QueG [Acidobacteriota bacterium]HQQ47130.1 tRNA epoxyqueuosine(34) reductase QueG [Acidobacteriota bacterium]